MAQASLGYSKLPVSSTAVGPATATPAIPAKVQRALIRVRGGDVMIRDDGTPPTASEGLPLLDGDAIWFDGDIYRLKAIAVSTDATLYFLWY